MRLTVDGRQGKAADVRTTAGIDGDAGGDVERWGAPQA